MDPLIPPAWPTELIRSAWAFLKVAGMVVLIVTAVVTFMELLRVYRLLDPLLHPLYLLFSWMRIGKKAVLALLVGILFGIAYGGGVLLEERRSGALSKRDALLIGVFLSLCHALIEDTLIFLAVGADPAVIVLVRMALAVTVVLLLARLLGPPSKAP